MRLPVKTTLLLAGAAGIAVAALVRARQPVLCVDHLGPPGAPGEYGVIWKPRRSQMERVEPVTDGSFEQAVKAVRMLQAIGYRSARPVRLSGLTWKEAE